MKYRILDDNRTRRIDEKYLIIDRIADEIHEYDGIFEMCLEFDIISSKYKKLKPIINVYNNCSIISIRSR